MARQRFSGVVQNLGILRVHVEHGRPDHFAGLESQDLQPAALGEREHPRVVQRPEDERRLAHHPLQTGPVLLQGVGVRGRLLQGGAVVVDHPADQDDGDQQADADEYRGNRGCHVSDVRPLVAHPPAAECVSRHHQRQDGAQEDEPPVAKAADEHDRPAEREQANDD